MNKISSKEFLERVLEFITATGGFGRNSWFESTDMDVYLRVGQRLYNENGGGTKIRWTVDVANVYVKKPGQGIYSNFLKFIEENTTASVVYIENIHEIGQCALYERRGYVYDDRNSIFHSGVVKCMYKFIKEKS